ncbi:MAG: xanthine dehydrogenase family protein molybdopterin-binding subunit [Desulfobacteraceae bacterium]|jgi:xanthine dehydrogenase molybdenum-binding subunit
MSTDYRFIGKKTPRRDALDIVTGKARYIDDIQQPGMLYGKVLRSPYPHANIVHIQTDRAMALPGVRAVLTHKDVPEWKTGMPRHLGVLNRRLRHVGDAVALVAAETEEQACEALDWIEVEYEKLPAVYDVEEAMNPDAPQLHDDFPGNRVPPFPAFGPKTIDKVVMGDVEEGFRSADFVNEGTVKYENIANPLPIEPPGVIAQWEDENRLTVWSGTQSASWHRFIMQSKMGFPDIRAIDTHCGGSFGSKNYAPQPLFYAAALAKATGRPVKVCYTKEEHFGAFVLRLGSRFRGKIGMKKDGTVTAVSGEWFINSGAYSDMPQAQIAVGCGEAQLVLRCPNWDLKTHLVCTNRCASGVIRGFGGQELESSFGPILHGLMEQADLDPVEFFKRNYVKPGDTYLWREGNVWTCRGNDYSRAIDKGAEAFGWKEKWKGWGKPTTVQGTQRIGVGVGVHGNADVGEDESEAYVRLNPDGTAVIHVLISESGMGQRSSLCKMAAEVLQLPLERIHVTPPDTLLNPYEFGLVGSRGTYAVGSAVIKAAEDARKRLFELAAPKLEAAAEDLETRDGAVFVKDTPERSISWSRAIGLMQTCMGFGRFEPDFSVPNFLILFTEVAVDMETGRVDLTRALGASDVGRIIDPLSLEGQLYGSLGSAGVDSAVFEESVLDTNNGHIMNMNMMDYTWRTALDLPWFKNEILETPLQTRSFGAIGLGEISTSPGPAAILMAVSNAVGQRFYDYPLTPDKILKALGDRERGKAQ